MDHYSIILPIWTNLFFYNHPSVESSSDRFAPQATKLKATEQDNSYVFQIYVTFIGENWSSSRLNAYLNFP